MVTSKTQSLPSGFVNREAYDAVKDLLTIQKLLWSNYQYELSRGEISSTEYSHNRLESDGSNANNNHASFDTPSSVLGIQCRQPKSHCEPFKVAHSPYKSQHSHMNPTLIPVLMVSSWDNLPISQLNFRFNTLYREGWTKIGTLPQQKRISFCISSLSMMAIRSSIWKLLFDSLMMPHAFYAPDPMRPTLRTLFALENLLGSSKSFPSFLHRQEYFQCINPPSKFHHPVSIFTVNTADVLSRILFMLRLSFFFETPPRTRSLSWLGMSQEFYRD